MGNFLGNLNTLAQAIEQPAHYPQINLLTGTDLLELQIRYSTQFTQEALPRFASRMQHIRRDHPSSNFSFTNMWRTHHINQEHYP